MSIIVRPDWSPPAPHGGYGILGDKHPSLPGWCWVEWIDGDGHQRTFPRSGEPAEGYYRERYLRRIGTRLFSA